MRAAKRHRQDGAAVTEAVAVHHNRQVEWSPKGVTGIAACPGSSTLAIGYDSGAIEIWDSSNSFCVTVRDI